MPAHDTFHEAVKHGLIKDGWTITHDPYPLEFGGTDLYVDLGAEKMIAAERGNRAHRGRDQEFHRALVDLGLSYRTGAVPELSDGPELRRSATRVLFLAVPRDTYDEFFTIAVHRGIRPGSPRPPDRL